MASAWLAHRGRAPDWLASRRTLAASWASATVLFVVLCTQFDLPILPLFTGTENLVVRLVYSFVALLLVAPGVFASDHQGPVRQLLANPVMVWLGLISYGIYIWHEAIQDLYLRWTDQVPFATSAVEMGLFTLALTIPVSALSFYIVERPAMRFRRTEPPASGTRVEPTVTDPSAVG